MMVNDSKFSISDILTPQRVRLGSSAQSKKNAFEQIAELFATNQGNLDKNEIFDGLVARERLGNTALGEGVALPHCRLTGVVQPIACFIHFKQGIDYDSLDHTAVDLLFSLIVPLEAEEAHLNLLAEISTLFHQEAFRDSLRQAKSAIALYESLISA